jgi:hypothetical protein
MFGLQITEPVVRGPTRHLAHRGNFNHTDISYVIAEDEHTHTTLILPFHSE